MIYSQDKNHTYWLTRNEFVGRIKLRPGRNRIDIRILFVRNPAGKH
jgi:hypothetical protein